MISIQRRLTVGFGVVCCLLGGAGGLALYLILRAGLVAEFDQALTANAEALALQAEQSRTGFKFDPPSELMPAFERVERPDYFELWESNGAALGSSQSLHDAQLPQRAGTLTAPLLWNLTLPDGLPGRAIGIHFLPPVDDEAPPPSRSELTLVVARDRTALDRRLNGLATTLLVVGAAMAAALAFVVSVVVRRGLQPLEQLAARAATIDAASLQLRFPTEAMPAELLPIGQRLNDLLARLEASFTRERRFSADVAHELRTPIAELRALSEVALKWPGDAPATTHALEDALAIALQMEFTATRLLDLARCEAGILTVRREPVRLAPLVEDIWQPLADPARAKNLTVDFAVPADACWLTDTSALRSIITNLLANAIEYSPVAGAIHLRVENERLLVANTTENLAPADLAHLFERFWRKDPARSSPEHCGLGLALTKAYADALGLQMGAEFNTPTMLTFTLSGASVCDQSD